MQVHTKINWDLMTPKLIFGLVGTECFNISFSAIEIAGRVWQVPFHFIQIWWIERIEIPYFWKGAGWRLNVDRRRLMKSCSVKCLKLKVEKLSYGLLCRFYFLKTVKIWSGSLSICQMGINVFERRGLNNFMIRFTSANYRPWPLPMPFSFFSFCPPL